MYLFVHRYILVSNYLKIFICTVFKYSNIILSCKFLSNLHVNHYLEDTGGNPWGLIDPEMKAGKATIYRTMN